MYCGAVTKKFIFNVFLSFFLYNPQYMVLFFQFSVQTVPYLKDLL